MNARAHSQRPKQADAVCSRTVLHPHVQLPNFNSSNKNNYCPLQRKQAFRLVYLPRTVFEIGFSDWGQPLRAGLGS